MKLPHSFWFQWLRCALDVMLRYVTLRSVSIYDGSISSVESHFIWNTDSFELVWLDAISIKSYEYLSRQRTNANAYYAKNNRHDKIYIFIFVWYGKVQCLRLKEKNNHRDFFLLAFDKCVHDLRWFFFSKSFEWKLFLFKRTYFEWTYLNRYLCRRIWKKNNSWKK